MVASFVSPTPNSAYWQKGNQFCQSTGRAVLSDMRAGLIWEARGLMSADADSAAVQNEDDEAGRSGWSPAILNTLANALSGSGFSANASAARADASRGGQTLSLATMQGALWAAYSLASRSVLTNGVTTTVNKHFGSPSDYTFQQGTIFPTVGSIPPMPTDSMTSGSNCAPGSLPGSAMVSPLGATGITTINPLLALVLGVALVFVANEALTRSRKAQGSKW